MAMRSQEKAASVELLAYKFAGYPDGETEHKLASFCGAARFLWNRFLADSMNFYAIMGNHWARCRLRLAQHPIIGHLRTQ